MTKLSVFINTWNRFELFHDVLGQMFAVKDKSTEVFILDDCSDAEYDFSGFDITGYDRLKERVGCAFARKAAIEWALGTGPGPFLFMDNDLLLSEGFDTIALELWLDKRRRHLDCAGSPYCPKEGWHRKREIVYPDYIWGASFPGTALFLDKENSEMALKMPPAFWNDWWDWALGGWIAGVIRPLKTMGVHIGTDSEAKHSALYE